MNILFLDFDGVISTHRAYYVQRHFEDPDLRWLDPIACKMIRDLCIDHTLHIVVTSTWRNFGYETCVTKCLGEHGLDKFVHMDWRTDDLWTNDSSGSRPREIDAWLEAHPWTHNWLILDDDSFAWTEDQAARWVKTDGLNGLSTEDYNFIDDYFKVVNQ